MILDKDRRQNVIHSLPEVILLERKSLASESSAPGTEGTFEREEKKKEQLQKTRLVTGRDSNA